MRIDTTKRLSLRDLESPIAKFTDPFEYTFTLDQTLEDVINTLQSKKISKRSDFFYVTDKENVLLGLITLHDILYNPPKTPLTDILDTDFDKVYDDEPLEKGLKVMSKHHISMIPVVNREDRFVGVVEILPHEDPQERVKKVHYKHLKEDIFQFIGFSIEQRKWKSPWTEYRLRMPWLLCNLVGGLICAVIGDFFELTLIEFVILAFFIPLVLTLSESVGIQSMTLSLRFLHIRRIQWSQVLRRLFIEGRTSFFLAASSALIISGFYFAWSLDLWPVIAIATSVIVAMMSSALFGASFPIILHLLHLDPKVAAGPVVLMMADIITIAIYLSLSTALLM